MMYGAYVAFGVFICVWGTLRTGLYLSVDIMLLVWTLLFSKRSRTDLYLDARLLIMRTDAQDCPRTKM